MVIEQDARRFITEAIRVEVEMQQMEQYLVSQEEDVYGNPAYNTKRQLLIF
jgi:hypothetical protein